MDGWARVAFDVRLLSLTLMCVRHARMCLGVRLLLLLFLLLVVEMRRSALTFATAAGADQACERAGVCECVHDVDIGVSPVGVCCWRHTVNALVSRDVDVGVSPFGVCCWRDTGNAWACGCVYVTTP